MVDTVATTVGSLEYKQEAGSRCGYSLMEQQCRCRYRLKKTVIVQLLGSGATSCTVQYCGVPSVQLQTARIACLK